MRTGPGRRGTLRTGTGVKAATWAMRVTGLVALVAAMGCGPSPRRVCQHMKRLTSDELGEAAAAAIDDEACRDLMRRERQARGITEYRAEAKCILDATSYAEFGECSG